MRPDNGDLFRADTLKILNFGRHLGQKGSPAKGPGKPLRVAAQYSQKRLKNNGLFGLW
jgi:hypothetical protein